MAFQKAVKRDAKGRVAFIGPAGSGKSYTMLTLARLLAGPTGKIACIDTEHGSLSKYADVFDFDVDEMTTFDTTNWLNALTAAEKAGYDVFCTDSFSHFWIGQGGALDFVDQRAKAGGKGDSFSGWKAFKPHERMMIDRMIASPCHIIVTMRTHNEYVEETNDRNKKVRRKIGLKPVQREGLEYEFDLVCAMNDQNTLTIDKHRVILKDGTSPYDVGEASACHKPKVDFFKPFVAWLAGDAIRTPVPGTPQVNGQGQNPSAPKTPAELAAWIENELPKADDARLTRAREKIWNDPGLKDWRLKLQVLWCERAIALAKMLERLDEIAADYKAILLPDDPDWLHLKKMADARAEQIDPVLAGTH